MITKEKNDYIIKKEIVTDLVCAKEEISAQLKRPLWDAYNTENAF